MKEENKAIEIVKSMIADGIVSQEAAEKYFPELAESEDEKVKKSLIRLVKAFYDVNFPTPEGFSRKDLFAWLEKQGEQKPVEWSEEDEICRYNAIHYLEKPELLEYNKPNKDIVVKWLKSLRPQKHWKPTEEQLTCLEDVIYVYKNPKHLTSLLNELKAL